MNTLKTFVLLFVLTALLVLIGQVVAGQDGMVIALLFAGVMNFISWWFSDKIILMVTGARKAKEGELEDVKKILEELARQNSIPVPQLYIMETDMANAFATGRNPSKAVVAVTRGIVQLLNHNELKGVIAHELAHIKNRDTLIATVAATIAGAIFMLARMAQWAAIFGGARRDDRGGRSGGFELLIIAILAPLAAMVIQMAISRSREYAADRTGAYLSNDPLSLASALRKLSEYTSRRMIHGISGVSDNNVSPITSHLFIVHPFGSNKSAGSSGIFNLFSTHPPIEERIKRLEQLSQEITSQKYGVPKIIY